MRTDLLNKVLEIFSDLVLYEIVHFGLDNDETLYHLNC